MSFRSTEEAVDALVAYGLKTELILQDDAQYAANMLFDVMDYEPCADYAADAEKLLADADQILSRLGANQEDQLEAILKYLLDDAAARGLIDGGIASRDLFDTRLMSILTPRPSQVVKEFRERYEESPVKATDYFYKLSKDSDYIRAYRIKKDRKWSSPTKYGDIDITINLSKPEKDPKAIAAALQKKQDNYPKCQLCPQNIGYHGRLDHPARQTIRLIPMELDNSDWFMQYSPYVYYNEHCILLSAHHEPMSINHHTFVRLMQFIEKFPHYIIGSNADLPIVGGSILTHEHYQGGHYEFPMARAKIRKEISFKDFPDVKAGIVNWPMSVIRLNAADPERLIQLSDKILTAWRGYSDEACEILAFSGETPHNTITPIARRREGNYEIDLVLRNNRTTDEYPLGIFHPHAELHHIKKENIGLIEVMGLAILPARLLGEMELLKNTILEGKDVKEVPELAAHAAWAEEFLGLYPELQPAQIQAMAASASAYEHSQMEAKIDQIIKDQIGIVFAQVLEHAGVYKDDDNGRSGFDRFVASLQ